MKTETKQKIIADYIRERNRKSGLALKAKMPKDYYKIIGAKGNKSRWEKAKEKDCGKPPIDSVAGGATLKALEDKDNRASSRKTSEADYNQIK